MDFNKKILLIVFLLAGVKIWASDADQAAKSNGEIRPASPVAQEDYERRLFLELAKPAGIRAYLAPAVAAAGHVAQYVGSAAASGASTVVSVGASGLSATYSGAGAAGRAALDKATVVAGSVANGANMAASGVVSGVVTVASATVSGARVVADGVASVPWGQVARVVGSLAVSLAEQELVGGVARQAGLTSEEQRALSRELSENKLAAAAAEAAAKKAKK